MDRIEIHKEVIHHLGIISQLNKAIEEIGELIVEIDKEDKSITAITSELADVCNMTEQLLIMIDKIKKLYKISEKEVEEIQNEKMWRTEKIIEEK